MSYVRPKIALPVARRCTCRGTPPVPWYSHSRTALASEWIPGKAARCRRTLAVAAAAVCDPIPHRSEDLLLRGAAGDAAVLAAAGEWTAAAAPVELRLPVHRSVVRALPALLAPGSRCLDAVVYPDRLPDGVRDCALRADRTQRAADDDRPAFLDLLPAARVCVDGS